MARRPQSFTTESPKYDTPTMNDLLLRIFGEENRELIHTILSDLDDEDAQAQLAELGVGDQTSPAAVVVAVSAAAPDPFKAFGEELQGEERHGFLEAFKR